MNEAAVWVGGARAANEREESYAPSEYQYACSHHRSDSCRSFYSQCEQPPSFIKGEILKTFYDGVTNDLLTGGLGKSGLANPTPPPFADPLHPTATELRTRAIHGNYRALVDMTTGGGYGVFYGPNVTLDGRVTTSEGLIAGHEFLAFAGNASGRENVVLMVQVPTSFDPAHPCIVTAPSSGSRGIYGAIATAGEWGLKRECAVAYTDKGTGTGAHNLQTSSVNLITGERIDAAVAGKTSHFTARVGEAARATFNHPREHASCAGCIRRPVLQRQRLGSAAILGNTDGTVGVTQPSDAEGGACACRNPAMRGCSR